MKDFSYFFSKEYCCEVNISKIIYIEDLFCENGITFELPFKLTFLAKLKENAICNGNIVFSFDKLNSLDTFEYSIFCPSQNEDQILKIFEILERYFSDFFKEIFRQLYIIDRFFNFFLTSSNVEVDSLEISYVYFPNDTSKYYIEFKIDHLHFHIIYSKELEILESITIHLERNEFLLPLVSYSISNIKEGKIFPIKNFPPNLKLKMLLSIENI